MEEHVEKCQKLKKEIRELKEYLNKIKPLPALTPLGDHPPSGISASKFKEIRSIKKKIEEKEKESRDYCSKNSKYE